MKRDKWEFLYTQGAVCEQAKRKNTHHAGRLAWWEAKQKEVMAKIKEEGLEIDESLASITSNSYQRGATVNVRVDLMKDLNECTDKIREHRAKTSEYAAWVKVLEQPSAQVQLALNQDDYLYFFGEP